MPVALPCFLTKTEIKEISMIAKGGGRRDMLKSKRECMKNIILPPFVSGSPVCDMFLPVGTSSPPKPIYFFILHPSCCLLFFIVYCSPPLPFSCPILSYLPFFLCQSHINISQLHISHPFTQTHAGTQVLPTHSVCLVNLFYLAKNCVPNRVKV